MYKIRVVILLVLTLILCMSCSKSKSTDAAQNGKDTSGKRIVEVVSTNYVSGVSSTDVALLKAKIIEELSNRGNIRLIDRSKLNDVLDEHQRQQSLWASEEALAEVGNQYNANALVYLEAISKTEIIVTIEDVNTFQQVVKVVSNSNVSEIRNWDLSILAL